MRLNRSRAAIGRKLVVAVILVILVGAGVVYLYRPSSGNPTTTSSTGGSQPPIVVAQASALSADVNGAISFSAAGTRAASGTISQIEWNFGDGTKQTGQNVTHSYSSSGAYIVLVTATDDKGNAGTNDASLIFIRIGKAPSIPTVSSPPVAIVGASRDVIEVQRSVVFDGSSSYGWSSTATSVQGNSSLIASYAWSFGDGGTGNTRNLTHSFASAGNYAVTLTVTSNKGLTDTYIKSIRVTQLTPNQSNIKNPETYSFATAISEFDTVDQVRCNNENCRGILLAITDSLVFMAEGDTYPRPNLASSFNISSDGLTYTFQLRQGVKFTNGDELTADDVAYTFKRWLAFQNPLGIVSVIGPPLTGLAPGKYVPDQVMNQAIQVVDKHTVRLTLVAPDAPFIIDLARPNFGILNARAAMAGGSWSPGQNVTGKVDPCMTAGTCLVGTGAFILKEFTINQRAVLIRNDAYWKGPAQIKNVAILFVPEWSTRFLMLQSGEIDAGEVTGTEISQVSASPGLTIKQGDQGFVEGLYFNFNINMSKQLPGVVLNPNRPDWFSDVHLRRAFAYAFPYSDYIKAGWLGNAQKATGPLSPQTFGYQPSYPYNTNLTAAAAEFKLAWGGEVWNKGFTVIMGYQLFQTQYAVIGDQLFAQNLKKINPNFNVLYELGQWPTLLSWPIYQVEIFDGPDPSSMNWSYDSTWLMPSFTGYHNATLDTILNKAIVTSDQSQRAALYAQAQQIVAKEVPVMLTIFKPLFYVSHDYITGFYFQPIWGVASGYYWSLKKG